jgi:hypothetical protein
MSEPFVSVRMLESMQKRCHLCVLQEQFFQLWQLAPASSTYNSGFSAFISGDLDATALQLAAHMVFQRQEVQSGLLTCKVLHTLSNAWQA